MKTKNVKNGREKEIRRAALAGVIGILVVSMLAAMAVPTAFGQEVFPTSFYGNVTVDGLPAPINTTVRGEIIGHVGSPGNGSITVTVPGKYGAAVGSKLAIVTDSPDDVGGTIEFYIKRPSDAVEIEADQTATFDEDTHKLDLTATSEKYNLTMAVIGNGTVEPSVGEHTYTVNEVVPIRAIPDAGWQFVNWTTADMAEIVDPNSNETTVTVDKDKTVTANFEVIPAVNGSVAGRITYICNGTGIAGVTVNLTQGGSVVQSTVTDVNGNYSFTEVIPGNYDVNASKTCFWGNSTSVTVTAGVETEADMMLWLKGDLDNDCTVADADDLVLMIQACLRLITGDWKYDLNGNGSNGDIGDLVLLKRASLGEIVLA